MQVFGNRRMDKAWYGRWTHIWEFSIFKPLRILGFKSLQPVNHLSNWTWKWRLAVCVQPLPTPTFRFKPFRTASIIVPSAAERNLRRKALGFLTDQQTSMIA